jgi:two-component system chemotaxis response regulator CheB
MVEMTLITSSINVKQTYQWNSPIPIRILIVDDSAFMRFTISKKLSETPGFQVVGIARDGEEALVLIPKLDPDVITLDVDMPGMDGLTTLRQIMSRHPRPVIMLSSLTTAGARETVQALTLGAVDCIAKPGNKANIESIFSELVQKIKGACQAHLLPIPSVTRNANLIPSAKQNNRRTLTHRDKVVVIGASTGGPRALNAVIPGLPGELPAAVLIIQHMPVGFTRSLAERLNSVSEFEIKEAESGDRLEAGLGLVAPAGFHMSVDDSGSITLNQKPLVHGVRPAIDVTMSSIAQCYGRSTVGVILTGMGKDGTNGSALIHSAGGTVIVEDESTCVVWGMPRSVEEAGVADQVVPLDEIARAIARVVLPWK